MVSSPGNPTSPSPLRSEMLQIPRLQQRLFTTLGRKGAIKVLAVLFSHPDRELTAREIAAAAEIPSMSCSRILHEFHDLQIVRRRKIGRAFAISLDQDSSSTAFLERLIRLSRYD